MKLVGHLINTKNGLEGEVGSYYNYILASNGVFLRGRNQLIDATILVKYADVRGLERLDRRIELLKGRVPASFYQLAVSHFNKDALNECYLAITWDGDYHLKKPVQTGSPDGVQYERLRGTVVDMHSHGSMKPFFSGTDNNDEQGMALYIVVGNLDTFVPNAKMRVGVYGYFSSVDFEEVFLV